MATLAALLADVYSLTVRPDLVAESTVAVKAAVLKAHQSDLFYRDLNTSGLSAGAVNTVAYDLVAAFPRFRQLNSVQKSDPTKADPLIFADTNNKGYFEILNAANLFDDYKAVRDNIGYLVGSTLNLRSSQSIGDIIIRHYDNQDLTNVANMGWISDSHPYCIIFEATRIVFKTIGFDEQASVYEKLTMEQYAMLKASNIEAQAS